MRMLGRPREEYPDVEAICVTTDTGFGHRKPIPAAEWVKIRCAPLANPAPVVVVRNAKKTYLEMVERCRRFPSAQAGKEHMEAAEEQRCLAFVA